MARVCVRCGFQLDPTDQFCKNCGMPLNRHDSASTPHQDASRPTFAQQVRPASRPASRESATDTFATEVQSVMRGKAQGSMSTSAAGPAEKTWQEIFLPAGLGLRVSHQTNDEQDDGEAFAEQKTMEIDASLLQAEEESSESEGEPAQEVEPEQEPEREPEPEVGEEPKVEDEEDEGSEEELGDDEDSSDEESEDDAFEEDESDGADDEGDGSDNEDDDSDDEDDEDEEEFVYSGRHMDYGDAPTVVKLAPSDDEDEDDDEMATSLVNRTRYVMTRLPDNIEFELMLPCVVGRGRAADKKVSNDEHVGRKHAKLTLEEEAVVIFDLDSTNGTFVNGEEIGSGGCAELKDGDTVCLGTVDFVFHIEG